MIWREGLEAILFGRFVDVRCCHRNLLQANRMDMKSRQLYNHLEPRDFMHSGGPLAVRWRHRVGRGRRPENAIQLVCARQLGNTEACGPLVGTLHTPVDELTGNFLLWVWPLHGTPQLYSNPQQPQQRGTTSMLTGLQCSYRCGGRKEDSMRECTDLKWTLDCE